MQQLKEFDGKKLKATFAATSSSPFLEASLKKDIVVLGMVDPVDEYFVQRLRELDSSSSRPSLRIPSTSIPCSS